MPPLPRWPMDWPRPTPWWVLAAALCLQLPLLLNPGYFSHDELQWAVFAERGQWFSWRDFDTFQYRPLTFNLWMWLSQRLFAQPPAFHAALVAWGAANAGLLYALGRRFGLAAWPAALGTLSFALGPVAMYVHGWVATIGDLLWVSCALLGGWIALQVRHTGIAALAAAALTAAGLLSKEAALAMPALAAVAWWCGGRQPRWLAVTLASAAVSAAYLGLRLDALLHAPRDGAQYTLGLAHVPRRWLEYQLFAPFVPAFEVGTVLRRGVDARVVVAGLAWLALVAALWQAHRRYAVAFVLAGIAALAPVLPLASSWNQCAYGFAAIAAMVVAAAWPHASRRGRYAIALFAGLNLLHGLGVMVAVHRVGTVQATFSPALAAVVRAQTDAAPVRLRLEPQAREWIFARLTHDIPAYAGVAIADRVRIVAADAPADYSVGADGRLTPLR